MSVLIQYDINKHKTTYFPGYFPNNTAWHLISNLHCNCSTTLAVNKPYISTGLQHGHSTCQVPALPAFAFIQCEFNLRFIVPASVLQVSNRNACSFALAWLRAKDMYYSCLHAHWQSMFRQWIPVSWDRSCAMWIPLQPYEKEEQPTGCLGPSGCDGRVKEGMLFSQQFRWTWRRQQQLSQWEMCSAHSHGDAVGV